MTSLQKIAGSIMIFGLFCTKFTIFVLFFRTHFACFKNGTSLIPNYDQLLTTDLVDLLVRKVSCYKIVAVVLRHFGVILFKIVIKFILC